MGNKRRIDALLMGGLGNQLFIFATAYAYARELNCDLRLLVPRDLPHGGFGLNKICSTASGFNDENRNSITVSTVQLSKLSRKLIASPLHAVFGGRTIVEDPKTQCEPDREVLAGDTLYGYFQSYRNFASYSTEIRLLIQTAINVSSTLSLWKEQFDLHRNAIGVHIRLGDYRAIENRNYHGMPSAAYYRNAIEKARSKGFNGPVFIFSDEPDEALRLIGDVGSDVFKSPSSRNALDTMGFLANFPAIVMSNSSFSWWSAWLSEAEFIAAPSPWFTDGVRPTPNLILENWILLNRFSGESIIEGE